MNIPEAWRSGKGDFSTIKVPDCWKIDKKDDKWFKLKVDSFYHRKKASHSNIDTAAIDEYMSSNKNLPIVSFTSYGIRLRYCVKVIDSILNNTYQPYKIILTITEDDIENIPDDLQDYIDSDIVELLVVNENLRPHNKYFYVMKKYKDNPIITIDDDIIYPKYLIEYLLDSYIKHPNCVSCMAGDFKSYNDDGTFKKMKDWPVVTLGNYVDEPTFDILAAGVGGVLYPPDILKVSDDNLEEIRKYITADDEYLHYLEIKNNVQIVYVKNVFGLIPLGDEDKTATDMHVTTCDLNNDDNDIDKAIRELLK